MHSWHSIVVYLPLAALSVAVGLDAIAAWSRSARWRGAGTLMWWLGMAGLAAAMITGLVAYKRVEAFGPAYAEASFHRDVAVLAAETLVAGAIWRWRRPFSRDAALLGLLGALALLGVGVWTGA